MKKIFFILSTIAFLLSCEKKAEFNATFVPLDSNLYTKIKFVNAYPYATPVFSGQTSASVQLTHNALQFSATPIGFGSTFPASTGYAALFKQIAGLPMNVRLALGTPPAAVKDSLLFTFYPPSLSKYYSLFFCDSINKPNTILVTEDDVRNPGGPNLYRVRFANLIPNLPSATPMLELYSTRAKAVIFTGIANKGVTPFIELPVQVNSFASPISDTFLIRYVGSSTVIARLNTVAIQAQASITVFARGYIGAAGTRAPGLSSYRNR
jgi:hypothetical protein